MRRPATRYSRSRRSTISCASPTSRSATTSSRGYPTSGSRPYPFILANLALPLRPPIARRSRRHLPPAALPAFAARRCRSTPSLPPGLYNTHHDRVSSALHCHSWLNDRLSASTRARSLPQASCAAQTVRRESPAELAALKGHIRHFGVNQQLAKFMLFCLRFRIYSLHFLLFYAVNIVELVINQFIFKNLEQISLMTFKNNFLTRASYTVYFKLTFL